MLKLFMCLLGGDISLRKYYNYVIAGKISVSIDSYLKDMQFTKFAPLAC